MSSVPPSEAAVETLAYGSICTVVEAGIFSWPDTEKVLVLNELLIAAGADTMVPSCAPVSALFNLRFESAVIGAADPAIAILVGMLEIFTPSAELVCNRYDPSSTLLPPSITVPLPTEALFTTVRVAADAVKVFPSTAVAADAVPYVLVVIRLKYTSEMFPIAVSVPTMVLEASATSFSFNVVPAGIV